MYKIRVKFTKTELMKFISHLDLLRLMERAMRRADIPLAFSQGFNPHPKISFATATAIGLSSEGEYMDIEVEEQIDLEEVKDKMNRNLPAGIRILQCKLVPVKIDALMATVDYSTYITKIELSQEHNDKDHQKCLQDFLEQREILIQKISKKKNKQESKEVDIRPWIFDFQLLNEEKNVLIYKMTLATGSRGNLKPEMLIEKFCEFVPLSIKSDKTRIHRLDLYSLVNGKLISPIDATA
ncbi:MAG: TIGR03936 family radical SAM-associated protein [Bacillota bacterium]